MKLLTYESVEEMVVKRVKKKAMVFGQEVSLDRDVKGITYKVDPSAISHSILVQITPHKAQTLSFFTHFHLNRLKS